MRKIKFRIYDPIGKEFRYWGFESEGIFVGIPNNSILNIGYAKEHSQQYTGLNDRAGKEIYEGDIVQFCPNSQNKNQKFIKKIIWHVADSAFKIANGKRGLLHGWPVNAALIYNMDLKVIGNISETPELLK
jgi:uncharacterized phage protein (TIGR01671 family)